MGSKFQAFPRAEEIIRTHGITRSNQGLMRAGFSPVFAESKGELAAVDGPCTDKHRAAAILGCAH